MFGDQQVVFCFEKVGAVVDGKLEIIPMGDRILRTRLDAVTAEDAAAVVDVVDLCVTFVTTDAFLVGTWIVFGFDIYAVGRASRGSQITCDAFFLTSLIDVQQMLTAISWLDSDRNIGVLNGPLLARDLRDRALHPFDHRDS